LQQPISSWFSVRETSRIFPGIRLVLTTVLVLLCAWFALCGFALIQDIAFNNCGLSYDQAKAKVLSHMADHGWGREKLLDGDQLGSCQYDFVLHLGDRTIEYSVLSTWIHGVKLTYWDPARPH
jgi:hypothetical protein